MTAVGILGGTFNPPHLAHLVCASEARAQLELDEVMLVPTGIPPHKEMDDEPGAAHRVEMCRLAIAGHEDWLSVSEIEVDRGGPSYTVDTLREINARRPGDQLTFIVGGDMAWSLPSWKEPEAILGLASVAVAERIVYIDIPRLDISSSALRRRVRAGRSVDFLVADAVGAYIQQGGLYR